ncbi:MAG: DEAD/DEAH box helicase [Chromatiales bacterium]|nr:DEAD/DEAH box helicase [Chromatiales bacterium]
MLETLKEIGYEAPSPIQAATILFLLEGQDVLGQVQTGTGKTAAFMPCRSCTRLAAHSADRRLQRARPRRPPASSRPEVAEASGPRPRPLSARHARAARARAAVGYEPSSAATCGRGSTWSSPRPAGSSTHLRREAPVGSARLVIHVLDEADRHAADAELLPM